MRFEQPHRLGPAQSNQAELRPLRQQEARSARKFEPLEQPPSGVRRHSRTKQRSLLFAQHWEA